MCLSVLPLVESLASSLSQNTIIGLVIVLIASVLNALGLNLTKLDHTRQQIIPKRERRKEYLRILWLAGMGTYM
jgi:hypothetical protein